MNKKLLLAFAIALSGFSVADAQVEVHKGLKWDAGTGLLLKEHAKPVRASRGTSALADSTQGRFIITVTDAEAALDSIAILGGEARRINDSIVTARIPYNKIEAVAALQLVKYIEADRKVYPTLDTARKSTRADSVHAGIELETPYTGEGVIVAVIDDGFQYDHRAFLDDEGNSRVLAVWNRYAGDEPTKDIPSGHDGRRTNGHGTHVAGIAAGSVVRGNNYSGMAPGADIVMVTSKFSTSEILEDVQWIKEFAEEEGKPWVVNMSFGTNIGPHDGTTTSDQTLNNFCGVGALIVGTIGNDGANKVHVAHTFEAAGDSVYLLLSNNPDMGVNCFDLWSTVADGAVHLDVEIVVYNATTKTLHFLKEDLSQCGEAFAEINANNQKERYNVYVDLEALAELMEEEQKNLYLGLKITAKDGPVGFHAWLDNIYGEFVSVDGYGLEGDSEFLVDQGAASVPRAIAVGAYASRQECTNLSGGTVTAPFQTETGKIAAFSSHGPSLGSDLKPTVLAPGSCVVSSFSRYTTPNNIDGLVKDDKNVVAAVDDDGNALDYASASVETSHFYGVMSGTSMAAPAVSGILALWLQANPKLTPEDVLEIISKTAVRDEYTGGVQGDWTPTAGYGKIDAYAGLKMALEKLAASNHDLTMPATQPVTLKKGADKWRILFNVAEEDVRVSLYSLANGEVSRTTLDEVSPGDETVIDLNAYTPGVYIIKIVTPNAMVTRKVVVSH
ncbi:MAG: S8 family peptidase [Bacteroidales bacterium]|nr:S8 family peptidase [Bacteroidales bacterium]